MHLIEYEGGCRVSCSVTALVPYGGVCQWSGTLLLLFCLPALGLCIHDHSLHFVWVLRFELRSLSLGTR